MARPLPYTASFRIAALGTCLAACGYVGAAADDPSVAAPAEPSSVAKERPDVIVILADDLRFDGLSIAGNPWIKTPNLDRIAAEGAWFERAYVTTSRCCPARASLLTGRYAQAIGVIDNTTPVDFQANHPTYPKVLQAAGYRTGYIGKWHIPAPEGGAGPREGFDHWMSYERGGDHFDEVFNLNGEEVATEGFQADVLTDSAIEFVTSESDQAPYLLVLGYKNPHGPLTPPPRHAGTLDESAIDLPQSAADPIDSLPLFYQRLRGRETGPHSIADRTRYAIDCRRYWELVLSIDDNVGRLLAALEDAGTLDQTVIVFTADNGLMLGEHGFQQKGLAYEPSIRVPLALRYPPVVAAGPRTNGLALNIDVFPTLLELCGVTDGPAVDGKSLVPQLKDPAVRGRETFLYVGPPIGSRTVAKERAVVDARWKYLRHELKSGRSEALFDLVDDPMERSNVVDDPRHGDVLERLRRVMDAEASRLGV